MSRILFSDPVHGAMQLSLNGPHRATLTENAEIRMGEAADVRQNARQIGGAHAEPGRERGGKFVHGSCRNPAALAGVVGAVDGERGESAEQTSALNRAAEDELMAAPAVVGAGAVRRISAAE